MKIHFSNQRGERGIALIIVLIVISVLSVLAADFALCMKVETRLAANANADDQLVWLGRSGVEYAKWVLAQQAMISQEPYDALNQIWAGGTGTDVESNSALAGVSLDNVHLGDGIFSIKIVDNERKLNINTADDALLKQVMTQMGVDATSMSIISDSIQDWIDPDENARTAGAESEYYQTMDPPYYAKNAAIDDISELLLIKGIAEQPEIFFGGAPPNAMGARFHHQLGFGHSPGEVPNYPFGLKDVFTAISSGRLNINTASATVLECLPGMDPDSAAQLIKMRAGPDGIEGNEDDTPFNSPGQISQTGINPQVSNEIQRYCTMRSTVFEVTVKAQSGLFTRIFHAVIVRNNPNDLRVVAFYWD